MLVTPSGIIDIANGLVITSISLHSAWPGTDGLSNELSGGGYARQSISFPAAVTSPTRTYTAATTWSVPANATVAFYGMWNGSTFKAVAANGGSEKEVRRILTTGAIWCPGHGLAAGNRVAILGDWPSPFTEGSLYYVKSVTPDTLSLSATPGGAALAPATANANTNMVLSKIDLQVFGGSGTFTLTGMDLRWKWTDAGPVVNPEPTGFRWTSTRPIPPQEITLSANQTYDFLQHLTGGEPTSVKIVGGEAALNALGITYNEQLGALVAGPTLTAGSVDIVMRASDERIVDYTGQEFYLRVYTDKEWMPRDDTGAQHGNTGYGLGAGYWNDSLTKNGISSVWWSGGKLHTGIPWNYLTDFEATPAGTINYSGTVSAGAQLTVNMLTAVKDIFDGKRNHGWLLKPGTGSGTRRIRSRENTDANSRPKLTINGVTIAASSDGNLIPNTETPSGDTTFISVTGTSYAFIWFDLETFWTDNSITASSQITSATLTLTNETSITGTATVTIHFMQPGGADYWNAPVPQTGIAWPGSPTANANVKVGLRDENIDDAVDENGNRCVLWSERYDVAPTAQNYTDKYYVHYVQYPTMGNFDTSSSEFQRGDVITGADSEYPSMGTMTPMYANQRSMRMFWQGMNSPIGRLPYESANTNPGVTGWRVKSIGADGLFTLVDEFGPGPFAFGQNPFGEGATAYPRGFAPIYLRAGAKMPLPGGMSQNPPRELVTGGTSTTQFWGPPYYAMCVSSPGNNTFYISATPFGTPIVPSNAVTADLSWADINDYIRVHTSRRRSIGSFKVKPKPVAKLPNGAYRWPASAPYDYNGITSIPEFYFRAYFYVPSTFRLYSQGAKQIWGGVEGQFDGVIRGMGVGNGGLEGDLFGGGTIRGHSETEAPIPLMQENNVIQLTSYTYVPFKGEYIPSTGKYRINGSYDIFQDTTSTSEFGDSFNWNQKAGLGFMEKDRWYCIEWYAKMNSVVPNNEPIFIGDDVIPNYSCVVNGQVQPCPQGYACYNPIHAIRDTSIDPNTGKMRNPFGGPYPNTFRSPIDLPATWPNGAVTFKYSYVTKGVTREYEMFGPSQSAQNPEAGSFWGDANTGFNIGTNLGDKTNMKPFRRAIIERSPTKPKYTPGQGGDGKYKVWVNGRLAMDRSDIYFRAVEMTKDGVTPWYFNGPMLVTQVGGVDRDFFECVTYMSHAVLSTRYIGPMKIT